MCELCDLKLFGGINILINYMIKHTTKDPKDGDLCLNRVKPGETLVEARSDSDVQIDRRSWV